MKSFTEYSSPASSIPLQEAFTRQHYEAIAAVISKATDEVLDAERNSDDPQDAIERLANRLADIFAKDNPRFDKGFFLSKCKL